MIQLRRGDLFATKNPMAIGAAINFIQKINSSDNKSFFSHAGIIDSENGDTFEALWTVKNSNISNYKNNRIIIARMNVPEEVIDDCLNNLKKEYNGKFYPLWRLPFHIIPPLAKYISWRGKWVVCSELVAKYEYCCGMRHNQYLGTSPDMLVDEWSKWKNFEIIFDGELNDQILSNKN